MSLISMGQFRFWSFTLGILIMWHLVWISNAAHIDKDIMMKPIDNSTEQKHNCNTLCEQCDCMGFYCGEECICECNNDNANDKVKQTPKKQQPDTECLAIMQNNARTLNLPFELLIQGSRNNRIVRTALNLQHEYSLGNATRSKRATVVIYKPDMPEKPTTTEKALNRHKRGAPHENLDWITDFANGLVRPAPLPGNRPKSTNQVRHKTETQEQAKPHTMKTKNKKTVVSVADKPERMWFETVDKEEDMRIRKTVNKSAAVPSKKQRSSTSKRIDNRKKKDSGKNKRNDVQRYHDAVQNYMNYDNLPEKSLKDTSRESLAELLYKTPMKMIEKLPAAVRDAIRRIRMNAELANANKKREAELHDLEQGEEYEEDEDATSANSESAEEPEDEPIDEYVDDTPVDNFEEILQNMRKHLLNVVGMTTEKSSLKGRQIMPSNRITKSPYHTQPRSSNFMQRIKDAMDK